MERTKTHPETFGLFLVYQWIGMPKRSVIIIFVLLFGLGTYFGKIMTLMHGFPQIMPTLVAFRDFGLSILKGQAWLLKMGPIYCPETSVNNYQSIPRNVPEERRSHQWCCLKPSGVRISNEWTLEKTTYERYKNVMNAGTVVMVCANVTSVWGIKHILLFLFVVHSVHVHYDTGSDASGVL